MKLGPESSNENALVVIKIKLLLSLKVSMHELQNVLEGGPTKNQLKIWNHIYLIV